MVINVFSEMLPFKGFPFLSLKGSGFPGLRKNKIHIVINISPSDIAKNTANIFFVVLMNLFIIEAFIDI